MIRINIDIPKTFLSKKKRDMYYKAGFFMAPLAGLSSFCPFRKRAPQNTFSKNTFPRDLYSKGPKYRVTRQVLDSLLSNTNNIH